MTKTTAAILTILTDAAAQVDRARPADARNGPGWDGPGAEWWEDFTETVEQQLDAGDVAADATATTTREEQRDVAAKSTDVRTCTCHPDDNPPVPCPRKFALSECRASDLTRRIEVALCGNEPLTGVACKHGYDQSICPSIECATPFDRDVLLRDTLALLQTAPHVFDHLRASQAGGVPAGWPTDGIIMKDYWRDAIGSTYVPVKYSKHASWHPTTVKAELEAHRGEPVADVLAGMVFTLSINADREDLAWKRVAELEAELRDLRASPPPPATDGDVLREALEPFALWATLMDKDAPDDVHLPATVPHLSLTLGQARAAADALGLVHASGDPRFNGERDIVRNALASSPPPVTEIVAPHLIIAEAVHLNATREYMKPWLDAAALGADASTDEVENG